MPFTDSIQFVECPRDAMQGWPHFIPTEKKVEYLNALLQVGFHTLDFGSFVSPKAIPQLADTRSVLEQLDLSATSTRLLAIVANLRGAEEAAEQTAIRYIGFPFSVSPTFQRRNTNSTPEESFAIVAALQDLCVRKGKEAVIYISMGFGNPYGDEYSSEIVVHWTDRIAALGVPVISLADTVGLASPDQVSELVKAVAPRYPHIQTGVHLHSAPQHWQPKVEAALSAGCRRFDGAVNGIGGCPMAGDALVGNMDTLSLLPFFRNRGLLPAIDDAALEHCRKLAAGVFV